MDRAFALEFVAATKGGQVKPANSVIVPNHVYMAFALLRTMRIWWVAIISHVSIFVY